MNAPETTPNVSTPSHASPPATPKRRVRNDATASVLSARRLPPPLPPDLSGAGVGAGDGASSSADVGAPGASSSDAATTTR